VIPTESPNRPLEPAAEDDDPPPEANPLPPGYREILTLFEQTGAGLHAKDVCERPGADTEPKPKPKPIEGMRAKLKRLVRHEILTDPEPGLFILQSPPRFDSHST
jgi:hypothetical protein